MIKFLERKNFLEVSSFNCKFAWIFGYFHFNLKEKLIYKCDEYLRFILYVIVGIFMSLKNADISVGNLNSAILAIGIQTLITLTIFMPTIFRIFNFLMRKSHLKIVRRIHNVDLKLSSLGIKISHNYQFKVALSVTFGYFGVLLLTMTCDQILSDNFLPTAKMEPTEGIFGLLNIAATLSYQITHMLVILAIQVRINYVNQVMEKNELNLEEIKCIRKIHFLLCDTMSSVNTCYTLNLLNFFFQFTFFSIFFSFSIFHYLTMENSTFTELIFIIIQFGYFQFFFWFCGWIIIHSGLLTTEVERMESLVQSKEFFAYNKKAMKHFEMLNSQLWHSKLFVSSGLFKVDWTFLFAFIGTVFSYTIILIQFDLAI